MSLFTEELEAAAPPAFFAVMPLFNTWAAVGPLHALAYAWPFPTVMEAAAGGGGVEVPPKTGKSSAEGIRCDCCCCWRDCRCVFCRWPGVEGVDKDGRPPRVFGEEEYGFGRPPARGAPSPFSCPSTW